MRRGVSPRALMMKGDASCKAAAAAAPLSTVRRRLEVRIRLGAVIGLSLTIMSNRSNRLNPEPKREDPGGNTILNLLEGIHKTLFFVTGRLTGVRSRKRFG